jgi:ligand-binding SRPBCC domain-containing protein
LHFLIGFLHGFQRQEKPLNYQHRFTVKAPCSRVAEFHQSPASMAAITPPPINVKIYRAPASLRNGSKMEFTLRSGPLLIYWTAQIEQVSESGFTDRQESGPFAEWVHRHSFLPLDGHTTEVTDHISLRLKTHPVWGLVGLGFWLGLPLLFAFRGWKTRQLLEKGAN